jgi:hypothetical protein
VEDLLANRKVVGQEQEGGTMALKRMAKWAEGVLAKGLAVAKGLKAESEPSTEGATPLLK